VRRTSRASRCDCCGPTVPLSGQIEAAQTLAQNVIAQARLLPVQCCKEGWARSDSSCWKLGSQDKAVEEAHKTDCEELFGFYRESRKARSGTTEVEDLVEMVRKRESLVGGAGSY
jgi:hypothetical protein